MPDPLPAIQMVSATTGWALGQHRILHTGDGGNHWTTQLSGSSHLRFVDATDASHAWAVAPEAVLATTDGGAHWQTVNRSSGPQWTMVHFVSSELGWGITTGGLVQSSDGGRTWRAVDAPCGAEMVCFSDPSHGWLGVRNRIYRSDDGGSHWAASLAVPGWDATGHTTSLQCVRDGAWAYFGGQGAATSHVPYIAYHATVGPWNPVMKEQMTGPAGVDAPAGGTYPAPMSAVSADTAVFVTYTPPGDPPVGMVLAKRGGRALTPIRSLPTAPGNAPVSASFVTLDKGWVIVTDGTEWVILATSNGGASWHEQARTGS